MRRAAGACLLGLAGGDAPECRGLARPVYLREGLPERPVDAELAPGDGGAPCRAIWLSHEEAAHPEVLEAALGAFDAVLTGSLEVVPFAARRGRVHFLERVGELHLPKDPDALLLGKQHMLSVLLPAPGSPAWDDPRTQLIAEQALARLREHTYVDDGDAATHARALEPYRFALIVDDEAHAVSQALARSLAAMAVPMFNGFAGVGALLPRGVVPFNATYFSLEHVRSTLRDLNHDIGWLWNYHRMLLDVLAYRYARPFSERLANFACAVCRALPPVGAAAPERAPLAFVGVYSAKGNFERRRVIRETWGRVLSEGYGLTVRFFLGEISGEPSAEDDLARWESTVFGDVIDLGVAEGYTMNSAKGLRFHEWCAKHVLAEFLVKVDDDVYLRPAPLVEILRRSPPSGFAWGYWDFMSPVPREEGKPFYNPEESYPFAAFPPYPRGLVRALSMDVVRHIARLAARGALRSISGDDPCLGVHLRQAVTDPEDPIPMLTIDDRDSYRAFAMEPSCNGRLWSHVTGRSWVVHHVTAEQMRCMWRADVAAGYVDAASARPSAEAARGAAVAAEVALAAPGAAPEPPPLPDVCECLRTGPMAQELEARTDKVNASSTYQLWGDPNFDGE